MGTREAIQRWRAEPSRRSSRPVHTRPSFRRLEACISPDRRTARRFARLRICDGVLAFIGLVVAAPILATCVVLVRATSPGPAIFRQMRVGRRQHVFTCYKLPTMMIDTASVASHEVPKSAVTKVGGFLRRTKLDELPQLFNILIGDMSLVGPRPCLPAQTELIEARRKRGVYVVRPGITGPAQIQGVDMSTPEALAEIDETWVVDGKLGAYVSMLFLAVIGRGQGDRIQK